MPPTAWFLNGLTKVLLFKLTEQFGGFGLELGGFAELAGEFGFGDDDAFHYGLL